MASCENCGTGVTAYVVGQPVFCDYCQGQKLQAENQELRELLGWCWTFAKNHVPITTDDKGNFVSTEEVKRIKEMLDE